MSLATLGLVAILCIGCEKTRSTKLDVDLQETPATQPASVPSTAVKPVTLPPAEQPSPATLPASATTPIAPALPTTLPSPATSVTAPATSPAAPPPATLPAPSSQPTTTAATQAARDRRVITAVDSALQEFRQRMDEGNTAAAVDPLISLADRVRSIAALRLPVASLCSKVEGFGVYEPLEPRLRSNHETNVVLYCELTGFHSRQGDRAMWETRVSQDVVLLDEKSQEIWKDSAPAVVDQCRNLRRDFYVARILRFPATIAPGQYTLKISMTDQFSNELAETTLPIQFVKD